MSLRGPQLDRESARRKGVSQIEWRSVSTRLRQGRARSELAIAQWLQLAIGDRGFCEKAESPYGRFSGYIPMSLNRNGTVHVALNPTAK